MGALKVNQVALNGGKNKAAYKRIPTSNNQNVLAFEREKNGEKVIFIANLSKNNQIFTTDLEGKFKNLLTNDDFSLNKNQNIELKPWKFVILQ